MVWKPSLTAISLNSGVVAFLRMASFKGLETDSISYIPCLPLYPVSLHFGQPLPLIALTLDASSAVKPKSCKTFGFTSSSGTLHSLQFFLASLCATTNWHAALIK